MKSTSTYLAGCVLAAAFAFSSPAHAQLLDTLGLGDVTEPVQGLLDPVLDPVIDTVEPLVEDLVGPDAPLTDIVNVNIDPNNDLDVTLLNGDNTTDLPLGDLGIGLPDVGLNLPQDDDVADILNLDDDDDTVVINHYHDDDADVIMVTRDDPMVTDGWQITTDNQGNTVRTMVPGTNATTRTVVNMPGGINNRGGVTGNLQMPKSSKLRSLLAVIQNRGWMQFVAGRGVCLPPFAVTQVREMLNNREENQLNDLLSHFGNEIGTMRQMMANCTSGPRLQPNDINRVIGVGISNGAPVLYVL